MLYPALLLLHSIMRWLVVIAGVATVVEALRSRVGRAFVAFTILLDVQFLVGLALYFAGSPATKAALGGMGAAMKNPELRYWAVEHPTLMIAALVIAHIGRARARRATTDKGRARTALVFAGIALVLILVGIPWPFGHHARPLFPGM